MSGRLVVVATPIGTLDDLSPRAAQARREADGGACEDSHHAAAQLVEAGIDRSRIRVVTGGFQEWSARRWPVERGPRDSGWVRDPLAGGSP